MKKIISILTCMFIAIGLFGCTKGKSSVDLAENVTFELVDVMKIKNKQSNSIYYYYMAIIENKSDKDFDTTKLSYKLTDDKDENIKPIDSYSSTPNPLIGKDQSTYIYGYIGFPNNNQKNLGLYFSKTKDFLPFTSVSVREADNTQIKTTGKDKFTLFEDNTMSIVVDTSNVSSTFSNGTTTLNGLKVTYKNKTKHRIVIPYLEPKGTLNGLNLSNYSGKGDFSNMDLEAFKRIDFSNKKMAPKTEEITGEASGYILYYLDPEKEAVCDIGFTFNNAGIDYTDKDTNVFTINLVSHSFGSTTSFKLSY